MAQLGVLHANFPGDHDYTLHSLVEELTLVERHIRDGSYKSCSCNPSKHLPLIAGLASEGVGFSEGSKEKQFMEELRNKARIFRELIEQGHGRLNAVDAEKLRNWARQMRRRINEQAWAGKIKDTSEIEEKGNDLTEMVESLNALKLSTLPELEERNTWEAVNLLSKKYGIPPPKKISFTDSCNPLYPNAAHIQRDKKTLFGLEPHPELDELVFCRGGITNFAICHEFDHYRKHYGGEVHPDQDEVYHVF